MRSESHLEGYALALTELGRMRRVNMRRHWLEPSKVWGAGRACGGARGPARSAGEGLVRPTRNERTSFGGWEGR